MEVSHLPCGSLEEVREFYERAGVQLCLAYILGISDIHKGNLIAHGKYPVIIDLETFPGILGGTGKKPWEYTVQRSGFLPVIGPGNVSLSAIGVDKIQNTSYKMPTVTHRATSDMTMGFKTVVVKGDENFPVFEGKVWDVKPYISHFIKGFEQAFEYILAHKDMFYDITVQCLPDFSRHVLQNTQVYFMYHNVSLRPELMRYGELRALTLRQMEKSLNCKGKFQARILDYEMDCVYHLCFPVYYAHGRDLYMGNGIRIQDYFTVNGAQRVKERICLLSKNDLILQRRIIELAFLPILKKDCHYNSYCMETRRGRADVYTAREIGHMLVSDMGIYGNGQLWLGIRYDEHGRAALKPVDDYFYGGLGGIAVFLKAAGMFYKDRACEAAFEKVLERLDSHTQIFCQNQKNKEHRSMGLFDGEASMVYTYRLLYQMTGHFDDLRRACRHCDAVLEHLGDVCGSDLLGGKAGVILILTEMYKETNHKKYLDGARELFRQLMGDVQVFSCGIGWVNKNQTQPLAGMAHGGSGIALALAALWSVDKNDDYLCVIEKILSYEDSLYCSSWKNWKDMRGCSSYEDAGANTMAWCHGAAGIYAARKSIYTLTGHWYGKVLVDDALLKLKDAVKTDQCLCHGNLGLWRILNGCTVNVDYGDKNSRNRAGIFESADSRQASGRYLCRYLSVEDRLNPGFMNGLSGIGYTLLQEAGMELPEVLFLEIV